MPVKSKLMVLKFLE